MRILVCIKHVPDAQSDRRIEEGRLVRGEDDTLNELDENALEAAVQLVEERGGEVIALSMGPEDAEESARFALQKGADRAVLITDERLVGTDVVGTAHVLAAAYQQLSAEGPIDLVLTGMSSLDGMTSLLPAALATLIEKPYLSLAHELSVADERVHIRRSADGYDDELSAALPAVVSVTDQVNEPRYPNFRAMRAARKKPLDHWSLDDLANFEAFDTVGGGGGSVQILEAEQAPARVGGDVVEDTGGNGAELLTDFIVEVMK
ncbi:electron transfer flavoprotein subunit beta/FixA family protein [Gleimia hominis]|uniref:Electron transfer flavoprotein subunit beta n=1 Tax=Gleimia hominis TaxID=595468 RepID=A0ABU3ID42_9ACTO|nr:electron transfer flavoprotein subunit beta/FixA family protein [Gleimia hominis]MDT3767422.1 electron transfer flavoprotein subunit beta/FixA family protein [Gleimia hominis]